MSSSETASLPDESSSEKDSEAAAWEPMPHFSKIQVRIDGDMCVITSQTLGNTPTKRLRDGTIVDAFRERKQQVRLLCQNVSTDDLLWEVMRRDAVGDEEDDCEREGRPSGTVTS